MQVFTDGACRGNPGPAAFAFIISSTTETRKAGYIGVATNNRAEYIAIIEALRELKRIEYEDTVELFSDSEVVVRQLLGEYEVKNASLQSLWTTVMELSDKMILIPAYVPRTHPMIKQCDALCNQVLDAEKHRVW
jgi:ribonuclease HI